MKPRLTVVSSHVRRLPERSPEYVEKHEQLRREVDTYFEDMLARAMELELAGLTAVERARIGETY